MYRQSTETVTFVTRNDIEAYRQHTYHLDQALQSALDSGDAANASRIAGQAAEARGELRQLQARFQSQQAMHDQENAWIEKQKVKVHEIQRSIADQRAELDKTQRSLHKFLADAQFAQVIQNASEKIRLYQVNLEQQNLNVDSIDMTSHPSASDAQQAAAVAANPSQSLEAIRAVRKYTVTNIQNELAYADQLARYVEEFKKFVVHNQRSIC